MVVVEHGMTADHHQHIGIGLARHRARLSQRRQVVRRHRRQPDRQQVTGLADHVSDRLTRHIDAEVGHLPTSQPQQVAEHRHRQGVELTGGRTERHHTARSAPSGEARSDPTDDAHRDPRRSMLDRDVEFACRPSFADAHHRRCQDVEIDLIEFGPRCHRSFDHAPAAWGITGDEPRFEPGRPGCLAIPCAALARRPGCGRCLRCLLAKSIERRTLHLPDAAGLGGVHHTETHVPVRGHVVDAELVGNFLQREYSVGHVRSPAITGEPTLEPTHPGAPNPALMSKQTCRHRIGVSPASRSSVRGPADHARADGTAPA